MRVSKYDVLRLVWKCAAVPSIMHGMDVVAWSESEIENLEVGQNRVARIALNAPRGDKGLSTFRKRHVKATISYKIRGERCRTV